MSFKRYGKTKLESKELSMEFYHIIQLLKLINQKEETQVVFELDEEKYGKWEITVKRL